MTQVPICRKCDQIVGALESALVHLQVKIPYLKRVEGVTVVSR